MVAFKSHIPQAVSERLDRLPKGLRQHIEHVRDIAGELAEVHGADVLAVDLAAAAHDLDRADSDETLLARSKEVGLCVHPVEAAVPILLHGPVAAGWLSQSGAVADSEVLDAIRWHTTGHPTMGIIAKIVYLADKLDPQKRVAYPHQDQVRRLASQDLDTALLTFVNGQMADLVKAGQMIHPHMLDFRNILMMDLGG